MPAEDGTLWLRGAPLVESRPFDRAERSLLDSRIRFRGLQFSTLALLALLTLPLVFWSDSHGYAVVLVVCLAWLALLTPCIVLGMRLWRLASDARRGLVHRFEGDRGMLEILPSGACATHPDGKLFQEPPGPVVLGSRPRDGATEWWPIWEDFTLTSRPPTPSERRELERYRKQLRPNKIHLYFLFFNIPWAMYLLSPWVALLAIPVLWLLRQNKSSLFYEAVDRPHFILGLHDKEYLPRGTPWWEDAAPAWWRRAWTAPCAGSGVLPGREAPACVDHLWIHIIAGAVTRAWFEGSTWLLIEPGTRLACEGWSSQGPPEAFEWLCKAAAVLHGETYLDSFEVNLVESPGPGLRLEISSTKS